MDNYVTVNEWYKMQFKALLCLLHIEKAHKAFLLYGLIYKPYFLFS